ncbi:hypothetical protein Bhyg_04763 [Pseudolycoriella hygida]|uniref:Uncharacterized protein n=1 Tax=Pseudolycoriella hygida TaxID=35572 RepID=A0A9Q0NGK3_9DIPT|nr:hypothetical protein Bhyg_04763 [Pseudolycoriella hygida]
MKFIALTFVAFFAWQLNAASSQDICRRTTVGRGVGTAVVSLCNANEVQLGALCYPKCQVGYEHIGTNICRKIGCDGLIGATDIGVSCQKPAAYGRGAGYALWDKGKCEREHGSCEQNGLLHYPKCRAGFSPVGCCICSPNCPSGYTDAGAFCTKPSYGNGVGTSRLGCPSGKQYDAGLCYVPCPTGLIGVGPLCWSACGGGTSSYCGIFCTSTGAKCADVTLKIVGSAVKVAASAYSRDTMGAVEAVFEGTQQITEPNDC